MLTTSQTAGQKAAMTRIQKKIDPVKENAIALIESYLSVVNESEVDYSKDSIIAREVHSIRMQDFIRWGDRNQITNGMILIWFRKDALELDVQVFCMKEEYQIDITEQDVISFILSHPNGKSSYHYNKLLSEISGMFKDLTGHNIDYSLARKLMSIYKPKLSINPDTPF